MSVMYNFLIEESDRMRKELDELKQFLYVVDVTCSHLLQDGDVTTQGEESVSRLLSLTKELQDKYDKEAKFRGLSS